MEDETSILARYRALVAELNIAEQLGLDTDTQAAYAAALLPHYQPHAPDLQLQRQLRYYHEEHGRVAALADSAHPHHAAEWREITDYSMRIIHARQLVRRYQLLLTDEDLLQIAMEALTRSLASYHYHARFTTWLHNIVTRSAHKANRDQQAGKRDGNPASLDAHPELDQPDRTFDHAATLTHAHELAQLVHAALGHDQRLLTIFWLRHNGWKLVEIGQRVQLSPSQVDVLLGKARLLVQQQPGLRAGWPERFKPAAPADDENSATQDRDD